MDNYRTDTLQMTSLVYFLSMALNTDRLVHGACESVECQIDVHLVLPSVTNTLAYSLTVVVLLNSVGRLDMWQGHDRRGALLGSSGRSVSQSVSQSFSNFCSCLA